jgi:hypothetical protein
MVGRSDLGHACGQVAVDTNVGHARGNVTIETNVGHARGNVTIETDVGRACGNVTIETDVGRACGNVTVEADVGRACGNVAIEADVGRARGNVAIETDIGRACGHPAVGAFVCVRGPIYDAEEIRIRASGFRPDRKKPRVSICRIGQDLWIRIHRLRIQEVGDRLVVFPLGRWPQQHALLELSGALHERVARGTFRNALTTSGRVGVDFPDADTRPGSLDARRVAERDVEGVGLVVDGRRRVGLAGVYVEDERSALLEVGQLEFRGTAGLER